MDIGLLLPLVIVAFLALLLVGHSQLAKGVNDQAANGALLLVLATLAGVLALGMVLSLDFW